MALSPAELKAQGFEEVMDTSPEALKAQGFEPIDAPTVNVTGAQFEDYTPKEDVTSWENRFKNAVSSDLGLVGGLLSSAIKNAQEIGQTAFLPIPMKPQEQSNFPGFFDASSQISGNILDVIGGQAIPQPTDFSGQAKEVALQGLVDPLSYVGAPLKATSLGARALGNVVAAPAIVGGGMAGESIEKGLSEKSSGVGKLFGSLVGGGATVATQGTISNVASSAKVGAKAAYQSWKNKDEVAEAFSSSAVKGFLEQTAKAEGVDNIEQIVNDFSKIHKNITGESAPILTAMSQNPQVMSTYMGLIKSDPTFYAKVAKEVADTRGAIANKATELFGPSVLNIVPSDKSIAKKSLDNLYRVQERVTQIDSKINDLSERFNTNLSLEDIGTSISNLVKAKEKLIRDEEITPLYESVKSDATANKVTMPKEGTQMIYDFVKSNRLEDLFTKGSRIERDVNNFFRPTDKGYPEVSFSNIMSLKNNINELKREFSPGTSEYRRINELSKKVEEARLLIPGDYNQRLKDADKLYYQRLGVPFNEQGVLDIDSKKYAEQVAPVITKTPSALDDFLQVSGKEGEAIARNAILAHFYSFAEGDITPKNTAAYMFKKKDIISRIPGLEDDFKTALVDGETLAGSRLELNDKAAVMEKQLADNFFLTAGKEGINYSQVAKSMLNDRKYLEKVRQDISQLNPNIKSAVDNTLKRAAVDNILAHKDGALNYILQPDNQKTVALIFGKDYVDSVKQMATISDSLARIDPREFSQIPNKVEGDLLGRLVPGLTLPSTASILRNRITSDAQKVITLASKISQDLVLKKTTNSLESILMDKEGLTAFNNTVKNLDLKNPVDLQKAVQAYSRLLPSRTLMSVKAGMPQNEQQEAPITVQQGGFQ